MSTFDQSIFRAYDMRGIYPDQMNEDVAYAAGQGFVQVMQAKNVVVGRDVRVTGKSLIDALIKGIRDAGANAIEIGVISTEMLYFAAATLECDGGLSVTASHNPSEWNGLKFIGKGAIPLTKEGDLGKVYDFINSGEKIEAPTKGTASSKVLTDEYIAFLQQFLPQNLPNLKMVANVNFGANGQYVDAITKNLPLEIVRLNWEQDGTFPKGTPDPLLPKNRAEILERIRTEKADFGVAWDADADRCFFYDDQGRFFHGYYITALLIRHFFAKEENASAIVERRMTWANIDAAKECGGTTVYSRTGHGYIKKAMRDHHSIVGGETSGHYYFRDYFYCDTGLVTFLVVLGMFAKEIEAGRTVGNLLDTYMEKYPICPEELNYITPDAKTIMESAAAKYSDAEQNHEDGLTVEYADWRFNLRMSSNEPVLRLNMEARSQALLDDRFKEVTTYIESFGAKLRDDHA
ncbi:MAG TPA: phosphomannomutase/phosphoglucomutase [Verrucomicrobiae bacterium]|nr:phosphomannomutase/phosphoglucomutase [Verrucomicrobiae bacterium]